MVNTILPVLRRLLALLAITGALTRSTPADFSEAAQAQFPAYAVLTPSPSYFEKDLYVGRNALIMLEDHDSGDEFFDSAYILAEIYLSDVHALRAWYQDDPSAPLRSMSEIGPAARALGAAFAVNGDFYPAQGVTAIRNGTILNSCVCGYDLCVLYEDGTMKTFRAASLQTQEAVNKALRNAWQAWSFGPVLLDDGKPVPDFTGRTIDYLTEIHPRTAIGYYGPGHYCLLNVYGYRDDRPGASLEQLSAFFARRGCLCAYNLDGGGSTHMWFQNREHGYPSEKRELPDLIYVEDLTGLD